MRFVLTMVVFAALAACTSVTPDDGAVVERLSIGDETLIEDTTEVSETAPRDAATTDGAVLNDNPDISDTQDFGAVSERSSIEDDKARLEAQRQQFAIVEETALPTREAQEANVVDYALNTTNDVGEKRYKRPGLLGGALQKRNCKKYRVPDEAQAAFLNSGGPKRDVRGLDPDGDGFACDWTPYAYRKLLE